MHTEIIVSLVSIVGAAAIALACDFLRATNAQLREENDRLDQKSARAGPRNIAGQQRSLRRSDRIPANEAAQPPRRLTIQRSRGPLQDLQGENVQPDNAATEWNAWEARSLAETASLPEQPRLSKLVGPVEQLDPNNIDMQVPPGMHPVALIAELLRSRNLFTGLVISIGVGAKDPHASGSEELTPAVAEFMAGLLRKSDFGCRVDHHEFLMICPGLRAAEAQRHLSHVSERLWDYKLRALGKSPPVFNMGGTEVLSESLSDAIASAKHRMDQSRHAPKAPALSLVSKRKKAM